MSRPSRSRISSASPRSSAVLPSGSASACGLGSWVCGGKSITSERSTRDRIFAVLVAMLMLLL